MADRDHPPEFVAAEAWRVFVSNPRPRAERKRQDTSPPKPKPVDQADDTDFWEAAWSEK